MTAINISLLSPPNVIETLDFETMLAERKAELIGLYPTDQQAAIAAALAFESEPMLKLLQNAAYRELILRARYNDDARAVLLAYAIGADLDHIGVTYFQEARLIITMADPAANPPVQAVYESDAAYRDRLQMKPESWSTAGPTEAYEFHALSANGLVKGARASSPIPGTTLVTILSHEGNGTPSAQVIADVYAKLNSEKIRPDSEEVIVQAVQILTYEINIGLYVYTGPFEQLAQSAVQTALNSYAVDNFNLGMPIILSEITKRAKQAGVHDLILNLNANINVTKQQAAHCTGVTVYIAGVVQP